MFIGVLGRFARAGPFEAPLQTLGKQDEQASPLRVCVGARRGDVKSPLQNRESRAQARPLQVRAERQAFEELFAERKEGREKEVT